MWTRNRSCVNRSAWRSRTAPLQTGRYHNEQKNLPTTNIVPPDYVIESEKVYDKGVNPQSAKRLVAFTRPYLWRLIFSGLLMLMSSAASVAGPYLVKIAIDSGLNAG